MATVVKCVLLIHMMATGPTKSRQQMYITSMQAFSVQQSIKLWVTVVLFSELDAIRLIQIVEIAT